MQVLGDLIELPKEHDGRLPLPWWHRAPLGFQTETACYVALVEAAHDKGRPVGDLIVSVLDPNKWNQKVVVNCHRADQPGVVADVFDAVRGLNISLAESVTMDAGAFHQVTLICESLSGQSPARFVSRIRKDLEAHGFGDISVRSSKSLHGSICWQRLGLIKHGWVTRVGWKEELTERYASAAQSERIDLTKAVVTADTDNRALRFVFPYKGARTVKIEHADEPNAIKTLTEALVECELNVLSALLRRGGVQSGNAMLVAVCEPLDGATNLDVEARVKERIRRLPPQLRAAPKFNSGKPCSETIWPRDPNTVVAHLPDSLAIKVQKVREVLPKNRIPVFVSRRFCKGSRAQVIADHIQNALEAVGCVGVEATPELNTETPATIFDEVAAKMWISHAGIVVVGGVSGDMGALSMNLTHEFGFLQGQTKPTLLLVEEGCADSLSKWSNINGVVTGRFPQDERAFKKDEHESISAVVQNWVARAVRR